MIQLTNNSDPKPEFYPSCGLILRDATNGKPFPFKKGSSAEKTLFKSRFVNGHLSTKGVLLPFGSFFKDQPIDLYFRTPSQYERYFGLELDQAVHAKWRARQPRYKPVDNPATIQIK